MDVGASPANVLAELDVDGDGDVELDVEVEVEMVSVAEDRELEPVAASVALVIAVIIRQIVSELPLQCLVFSRGKRTHGGRITSRCGRQDKIRRVTRTTSPRICRIQAANLRVSDVGYACIGAKQAR